MKPAFLLSTLASFTLASSAGAVPNIILCMTDDQGWGDTGYNGHPTSRLRTSIKSPGRV
jgi:hypothetical protein